MSQKFSTIDSRVEAAIKPVVYADIFDFPLTLEEVHRYFEYQMDQPQVHHWLNLAVDAGCLMQVDGYYTLPGRIELVSKRRRRAVAAGQLWPVALSYGRWLGVLPFVRMVAVTGSLAVDNPREGVDDIDYLIVTQPRRLWLSRAMIIVLVKLGHRLGTHLCPNYLVTERALEFEENLFSAREILQMKPVYGRQMYALLRQRNQWVTQFFPQSQLLDPTDFPEPLRLWQKLFKQTAEFVLAGPVGNVFERWLQKVQVGKHSRQAQQHGSADTLLFSADVCKGHYHGHGQRTLTTYQRRLQTLKMNEGLAVTPPPESR